MPSCASKHRADLDGLVVTHLPNMFYLTNFPGTAGIAVVTLRSALPDSGFPLRGGRQRRCRIPGLVLPTPRSCRSIGPTTRRLSVLVRRLQPERLGIEG